MFPHQYSFVLETTSFPSLAWPGGHPVQKSRCHSPLREKQVEVRLRAARGGWELSRCGVSQDTATPRAHSLDGDSLSGRGGAWIGRMLEVAGREAGM